MNNLILKFYSLDPQTDARLMDGQWSNIFIPEHLHPNLSLQKKAARLALYDALMEMGKKVKFEHMEIINHHYVVNVPGTLVSLSHTKDMAVAIIAKQGEIFSIGVDIERVDRPLKAELVSKFKNEKDDQTLSDLELWVLKEACFKERWCEPRTQAIFRHICKTCLANIACTYSIDSCTIDQNFATRWCLQSSNNLSKFALAVA